MFNRKKAKPTAPSSPAITEGWTTLLTPAALLNTPTRQRLLDRIWQYSALSEAQFDRLYRRVLLQYADYVQLLPASEYHHHAYPGGLLDHGLELVATALKLRQLHLLPAGATPEDQATQTDAWSAAIAYGALLHDIGKVVVDIDVECLDGERWHPWQGPLRQPYRLRYRQDRQYELHSAASGVLLNQILPADLLDWLSHYPSPWRQLLFAVTGHADRADVLGEIISQADRISTAQNTGANPAKALNAPARSLQHHLLAALRHLLKAELKLNQAGAAGWLTAEGLWLVSKTIADKIRAYLLAQSVDGVPSSNIALFDELQSHGFAEATPAGKAIWRATVTLGDWRQSFTVLKLNPVLMWEPGDRPELFGGTVEVETRSNDAVPQPEAPPPDAESDFDGPRFPTDDQVSPPIPDFNQPLFDLIDAPSPEPSAIQAEGGNRADEAVPDFIDWLKAGLADRSLKINDSKAMVHIVDGTLFLVTPQLFQQYANLKISADGEAPDNDARWRLLQKQFEKLKLHRKQHDGTNIWTCRVRGPRKQSYLKGYLLQRPMEVIQALPPDNSFLTLDLNQCRGRSHELER